MKRMSEKELAFEESEAHKSVESRKVQRYLAEIRALREDLASKDADAMVAHRWFSRHFGEVMDGRDFAVKCQMADDMISSNPKVKKMREES